MNFTYSSNPLFFFLLHDWICQIKNIDTNQYAAQIIVHMWDKNNDFPATFSIQHGITTIDQLHTTPNHTSYTRSHTHKKVHMKTLLIWEHKNRGAVIHFSENIFLFDILHILLKKNIIFWIWMTKKLGFCVISLSL